MKELLAALFLVMIQPDPVRDSALAPTLSDLVGEYDFLRGFHASVEGTLTESQDRIFRNFLGWKFVDLLLVAEQAPELDSHMELTFCRIAKRADEIAMPDGGPPIDVEATLRRVYVENDLATGLSSCRELRDRFQ